MSAPDRHSIVTLNDKRDIAHFTVGDHATLGNRRMVVIAIHRRLGAVTLRRMTLVERALAWLRRWWR